VSVYLTALGCVMGLAIGQILFKLSAATLKSGGTFMSLPGAGALLGALMLYGVTSLAWVWVLRQVELGRVYPLMALAFVAVPIGSHFFFGERFSTQYFVGVSLIMLGIVIAVRA
jgi:drug/metabolite transporter (DMT)-like permease